MAAQFSRVKKQTNAKIAAAAAVEIRRSLSSNSSGNVPNANWNRDNRRANLDRYDPRNPNSDYGARASVRDYVLLSDLNQPPAILPISASFACA